MERGASACVDAFGVSAPRFIPSTKPFQILFRRWGGKWNLRGIWDSVLPVIVVDRFRGPDEGSLRAITGESRGFPSQFPAIFFGALPDPDGTIRVEVEIHKMAIWKRNFNDQAAPGINTNSDFHLFTPIEPYNPVLNLSPVGQFVPGLNLDPPFTLGTVRMIGGANPVLPIDVGLLLTHFNIQHPQRIETALPIDMDFDRLFPGHISQPNVYRTPWIDFDPPLRLPAGPLGKSGGIALQWLNNSASVVDGRLGIRWTVLYNERPISD